MFRILNYWLEGGRETERRREYEGVRVVVRFREEWNKHNIF